MVRIPFTIVPFVFPDWSGHETTEMQQNETDKTERNGTERNRTEQNTAEQNGTEQNRSERAHANGGGRGVSEMVDGAHAFHDRALRLRRPLAISTVPYPSGSGRVDMLTSPVAAARAAVATGGGLNRSTACI